MKELDQWVEQLMDCKQLTEGQVKQLCDKVIFFLILSKICAYWDGTCNFSVQNSCEKSKKIFNEKTERKLKYSFYRRKRFCQKNQMSKK